MQAPPEQASMKAMSDAAGKQLTPGTVLNYLTSWQRIYIKSQIESLSANQSLEKYLGYTMYYFKQCSKFQIEIKETAFNAVISLIQTKLQDPTFSKDNKFEDFLYEKKYYNPELIPQQFFLIIKQKLSLLGRKITDFHRDPISVTYLANQIVKFKVRDIEWEL
jgi:hypothetical protein